MPGSSGSVLARLGARAFPGLAPALREREAGPRALAETPAPAAPAVRQRESVPLTALPRHATGVVAGVRLPAAAGGSDDAALARMALRLMEIGFIEGAKLRVVAFGQPGDDPIGVRVGGLGGTSLFALRRVEAACVWVWPDR